MTFLEFVCQVLLGPPEHQGDGQMYWECPYCGADKRRFHTRPLSKKFPKQRYYCYKCSSWGDGWDLIAHLHPNESRGQHSRRYFALKEEWESRSKDDSGASGILSTSQGLQGRGQQRHTDPAVLDSVYQKLNKIEKSLLLRALSIAQKHGVDVGDLIGYVCDWKDIEDVRALIDRSYVDEVPANRVSAINTNGQLAALRDRRGCRRRLV